MTFEEFRIKCLDTAVYMQKVEELFPRQLPEFYKMIGLAYTSLGLGEAGEIQNKVKKIIRDSGGEISREMRLNIADELGDLLYYIAATCSELELSMDFVALNNIQKLQSRKERGKLHGSGDKR